MTGNYNISRIFLDYMDTFLETIHHGGEHDQDIGS